MTSSLDELEPNFRKKVERFIKEHLDVGVKLVVLSTYRSDDEQISLFAQGRRSLDKVNSLRKKAKLDPISETENRNVITQVDGNNTKSMHQLRKACDLWYALPNGSADWSVKDPVRIKSFGAIAKRLEMKWGGDFTPLNDDGIGWDPDHLEDI
jgi:hypothetical protein